MAPVVANPRASSAVQMPPRKRNFIQGGTGTSGGLRGPMTSGVAKQLNATRLPSAAQLKPYMAALPAGRSSTLGQTNLSSKFQNDQLPGGISTSDLYDYRKQMPNTPTRQQKGIDAARLAGLSKLSSNSQHRADKAWGFNPNQPQPQIGAIPGPDRQNNPYYGNTPNTPLPPPDGPKPPIGGTNHQL